MLKTPSKDKHMLVDTHVHLHSEEFASDLPSVIKHAVEAGIECVINIATDLATSRASVRLTREYPMIYAAVGCHPYDARSYLANPDTWREYEDLLARDKVVAVGEIGLDYYRDHSPRDDQKKCFEHFLNLAEKIKKPIVIHQRDAFDDTMALMELHKRAPLTGVFHCFTGDIGMARKILDLNFFISIGGPVTFPKNTGLREAAAFIPEGRLLAETDCPYLAPQPVRGKRNEPAYVRYVIRQLAEVRGMSAEKMAAVLRINVKNLFGI